MALRPNLRGPGAEQRSNLLRGWGALCTLAEVVLAADVSEPIADSVGSSEPHRDRPEADIHAEPSPGVDVSRFGYEQSALLLAACHAALKRGIGRVVWPVHIGDVGGLGGPDQPPPLDLIADACDRAMLASQLASVDAGRSSMGVTIELPYVDFTDRQMIEVALDLGVPMAGCWWCARDGGKGVTTPCGQCDGCSRWQHALTAASPGTTMVQVVGGLGLKKGQRAGG